MARKKAPEEHENHERWLVSYADFITLLFAFFVVMYSLSSVNEGKYRVLADAMISAFEASPSVTQPIDFGRSNIEKKVGSKLRQSTMQSPNPGKTDAQNPVKSALQPVGKSQASPFKGQAVTGTPRGNVIEKIESEVARAMAPLLSDEIIHLRSSDAWLEVEVREDVLFQRRNATLLPQSVPVLHELANIFRDLPNAIQVEGFTDNKPIGTDEYPTNWELSAARAASVVRLFSKQGIDPGRMAAIGYGEHQPIADNSTPEGRKKNRRIVIVLSVNDTPRRVREQPKPEPETEVHIIEGTPADAEGEAKIPVAESTPAPVEEAAEIQAIKPESLLLEVPPVVSEMPVTDIENFPVLTAPVGSPLLPGAQRQLILPPKPNIIPDLKSSSKQP